VTSGPLGRRARAVALVVVGVVSASTAAAAAQKPEVVADGLANPRGMAFGPGGLYVAEAGRGGDGACIPSPEGGEACYGATGAIARVHVSSGRTRRVVTGLPSLAVQTGDSPGGNATGPHDISFNAGTGYFVVGLAGNPAVRARLGSAGDDFAGLFRLRRMGQARKIVDLGAYEAANDPDAGRPDAKVDSNPFSVDATVRDRILVTDAGGNTLLRVGARGRTVTLAVFPWGQAPAPPSLGLPEGTQIPYQPVPTGVVRNAKRTPFVGQLTGFPFPAGAADVFRVSGDAPTVRASRFTTIVDIAFDRRGRLYVLQISSASLAGPPSPGKLIRIGRNGRQTELAAGRLEQPTGLAVSRGGDVYVANKGGSATDGEIVRVRGGG
jgi:hypothetical protein